MCVSGDALGAGDSVDESSLPLIELCPVGINRSGNDECSDKELFVLLSNELERRKPKEGGKLDDGNANEVFDLCSNLGLSEAGSCGL